MKLINKFKMVVKFSGCFHFPRALHTIAYKRASHSPQMTNAKQKQKRNGPVRGIKRTHSNHTHTHTWRAPKSENRSALDVSLSHAHTHGHVLYSRPSTFLLSRREFSVRERERARERIKTERCFETNRNFLASNFPQPRM